jgi:hypothetical protein
VSDDIEKMRDAFNQYAAHRDAERERRLTYQRSIRGKGLCACCGNPVLGGLDFPSAQDCAGFFGGEMEEGDGICWWCLEDWCTDRQDQQPMARAMPN